MSEISKYPTELRNLSLPSTEETYFEKLRSVAQDRRTSHKKTTNSSSPTESQSDDVLEDLIRSIRPSPVQNFDDKKNNQSQVKFLRQIYLDNKLKQTTQQRLDNRTFTITTPDGNIRFDFPEQSMNDTIYMQLMQLVRLSNLDKLIQKIFHKSGEYHHVDYRENRRHQLEMDQEHYQNTLLANLFHPLKSPNSDKMNVNLAMAKAVHFRTSSPCFVINGIDISSRFHYDRQIIKDTCHRFHRDISTEANAKEKENNRSSDSTRPVPRILVLCTDRMTEIYRLFESLFKSYISPDISIIYITFEHVKPILTQYEQLSDETSSDFQSTVISPLIDRGKDVKVANENIPIATLEEDLSDERYLLDCFRTSSLILLLMKDLDESYLATLIHWYTEMISESDQPSTSNWSIIIEHFWLITSDYQRAEITFNIPKTNLFLWPTEHHDCDPVSIIVSSILCLPIALSIDYRTYATLIDGMSVVDKHCQETAIDRNICIKMALLRIWSNICERGTTAIIIDHDDLQSFGEYIRVLFAENENVQKTDHFSYDLITVRGSSAVLDEKEKASPIHPHSSISLDQLTPLTLGVLIGIYQLSIFFESIIRNHPKFASDLNEFPSKN